MNIKDLESETGMSRREIKRLCFEHHIQVKGMSVPDVDAKQIIDERRTYIGLQEYSRIHTDGGAFNGDNCFDREKLYDYIEISHFFGLQIKYWDELLFGNKLERIYFLREDTPILDEKLLEFFSSFGVTEEKKILMLLENHGHDNDLTVRLVRKFLRESKEKITPSTTEFVKKIVGANIQELSNNDLADLVSQSGTDLERTLIIRFLNFARTEIDCDYSRIHRKYKESKSIPSYSIDDYTKLAFLIFNPQHIYNQDMIRKALDTGVYAEMWVYIAMFFLCGWRAADVCRTWRYPELQQFPERAAYLGICTDTLYDDILADRIPEKVLKEICLYSMGTIDVLGPSPHKTRMHNPSPLRIVITESLFPFIGLLTLIGECCHIRTGNGYMQVNRTSTYQNSVRLSAFFGAEITEVLHGFNLETRRMNKSYLQGIEEDARRRGIGGVMSSTLASLSRNHKSLDTIRIYLKDHNLTGEDAETVLFMMFERGVFGSQAYKLLLTAYPASIKGLPMREQNAILKRLRVSPLDLEISTSEAVVQDEMSDILLNGSKQSAISILKALFEICQGGGKAKDEGCHCMRRARGEACNHPQWKTCIGNACRDVVVTKLGILPLLETLKKYYDSANDGDCRARSILTDILLPRYRDIINEVIKDVDLSSEDRAGLKSLMTEVLNE